MKKNNERTDINYKFIIVYILDNTHGSNERRKKICNTRDLLKVTNRCYSYTHACDVRELSTAIVESIHKSLVINDAIDDTGTYLNLYQNYARHYKTCRHITKAIS